MVLRLFVCVSVCYKSVFSRNGCTIELVFGRRASFDFYGNSDISKRTGTLVLYPKLLNFTIKCRLSQVLST